MRFAMLSVLLTTAFVVGCCPHSHHDRPMEVVSAIPVRPAPNPALLFNPAPTAYPTSAFAYRSDWPSTPAYQSLGQVIFFNEYFFDQQGPGATQNYTYRQFNTYRSGVGYRP